MELQVEDERGNVIVRRLYPELEERLAALPRLGVPVVMMVPPRGSIGPDGQRQPRLISESHADHLVQRARVCAGLPQHITLAGCRHGGMTLLGDDDLTESQIMSLSGHVTPAAARIYVKRTEAQRLSAARRRRDFIEQEAARRERKGDATGNGGFE